MDKKITNQELLIRLDEKVEALTKRVDEFIRSANANYVLKSEFIDVERRIGELESDKTWRDRMIVGSVITAVISLVIAGRTLL